MEELNVYLQQLSYTANHATARANNACTWSFLKKAVSGILVQWKRSFVEEVDNENASGSSLLKYVYLDILCSRCVKAWNTTCICTCATYEKMLHAHPCLYAEDYRYTNLEYRALFGPDRHCTKAREKA